MTDKTNVITVTQENLEWINKNVPGSSKQKRLEELLRFYQEMYPVVGVTPDDFAILKAIAKKEGCSVQEILHRKIQVWGP